MKYLRSILVALFIVLTQATTFAATVPEIGSVISYTNSEGIETTAIVKRVEELAKCAEIAIKSEEEKIKLYVDNEPVDCSEAEPFVDSNNAIQVSVRELSKILNYVVDWDQDNRRVIITPEVGDVITFTIGDNRMFIGDDDRAIEMKSSADIINGYTYVPIDDLTKALCAVVYLGYND